MAKTARKNEWPSGRHKNKNNTPTGVHFNVQGHGPRISGLEKKNSTRHHGKESPWEEMDCIFKSSNAYNCLNRDLGIDFLHCHYQQSIIHKKVNERHEDQHKVTKRRRKELTKKNLSKKKKKAWLSFLYCRSQFLDTLLPTTRPGFCHLISCMLVLPSLTYTNLHLPATCHLTCNLFVTLV